MSFEQAHELSEDLIVAIQERLKGATITVHVDPEGSL